eukprot:14279826-Ditylum_brightwellii.AAC.1
MEETVDAIGTLIDQQPAYNKIINAAVTAGSYHDNPMLNFTPYEVEFPDIEVKEYAANMIAENMLTQVDYEGFTTTVMEGIINHDRDEIAAVHIRDKYVKTYSKQKRL